VRSWAESAKVYGDRRVLSLLFLGFSSGLPFGVLAEPLTAWLAESQVSKTMIGLFALVSLPYSLKFLWAPLMDRLPLPGLTRRFGRRRGWALFAQAMLLVVVVGLGLTDPRGDLWWTAAFALAVAFASASQDVVIDAYRVEILKTHQLAAGAAVATFGWRVGQVGAAAGGLIVADLMPWPLVFAGMALLTLIGVAAVLVNPEPKAPAAPVDRDARAPADRPRWIGWAYEAVVAPFKDFLGRDGWAAVLLFILLYKFGDAVLAVMKVPFFIEIGFTKTEIAEIAKIFGVNAIILGGLMGGVLLARVGIATGLLISGVLMALSNLVFVLQAWAGHDLWMLAFTIAVENVTTGMGTTAFIAYLSSLCNVAYTATQYALLTSLMAFSRTALSSVAGWIADHVDWVTFFVITTLAALPGLLLLVWMMRAYPASAEPARGTVA
jgi:PAT family beta-lactamase induction signal transducer AmpG